MLGYLSTDVICASKLTVFLELRSWKTVCFSEQIMSVDKYPSLYSYQMEGIMFIHFPVVLSAILTIQDRNKFLLRQMFMEPINVRVSNNFYLLTRKNCFILPLRPPTPSKYPMTFHMGCIGMFPEGAQRQCLKYSSMSTKYLNYY